MGEETQPVIIIGTGRCGSTLLQEIFARHPNLAWLSQFSERYPTWPRLNQLAMASLDAPLASRVVMVLPTEAYRFWDHYFPGFSAPPRDLDASDAPTRARARVRNVLGRILTRRRHRLLLKITGWPRVDFFKALFPDAKFIHVYRDGRNVVNSLIRVPWWDGRRGPEGWSWGPLSAAQKAKWESHGRSPVALAAIQWEILMAAHERAKELLSADDLLEVRYEDLCARPMPLIEEITNFAGLPWSQDFAEHIRRISFEKNDHKWRKQMTHAQQRIVTECLRPLLARYRYMEA